MEPVIDLRVPLLHNPTVISVETVEVIDGVFGGMGGGMKDTQTNMQEGETKGRNLPNVLQEGESTDQIQVPIIHHGSKHQASHQLDIGKSLQGLGKENPYAGTSARQQEKEGLHSKIPQKDAGNTPTQPSNSKFQARLSKKRTNAIKKRQQKEMETENK